MANERDGSTGQLPYRLKERRAFWRKRFERPGFFEFVYATYEPTMCVLATLKADKPLRKIIIRQLEEICNVAWLEYIGRKDEHELLKMIDDEHLHLRTRMEVDEMKHLALGNAKRFSGRLNEQSPSSRVSGISRFSSLLPPAIIALSRTTGRLRTERRERAEALW